MKTTSIFDTESKENDQASMVGSLEGFLPTKEFQGKLRIEKCRVDRTGIPLSLALFFLKDELAQGSKKLHEFFVSIKKRTRETDIRGWINSKVIGLLLFNTENHGAERCVELLTKDWGDSYCDTLTRTYPDPLFREILEQPLKSPGFHSMNFSRDSVFQKIQPPMAIPLAITISSGAGINSLSHF